MAESPWRRTALDFELRAMRVEYVIRMLVAAGHVTQEKVDEAFAIARDFNVRSAPIQKRDKPKRTAGVDLPDGGQL